MAVLVSFITPSVATAAVGGTFLNSDSISWNSWFNGGSRDLELTQSFIAVDKAEVAMVIEKDLMSSIRKAGGHTFDLTEKTLGNRIFDKALNSVGAWYSYGGVGPKYFDCSGYTRYVFGKFGVELEHSATSQLRVGKVIPRSKAQLGDLVWMPGHIGFWAGDGLILDAMKPGTRVDVREIWTSYYKIIRIVDVDAVE